MNEPPPAATPPKKILIVDDNEVIVRALQYKLESRGYLVASAMDGSAAVSAIRRAAPDLILLDINFPPDVGGGGIAWDGFTIMDWVRHMGGSKNIPIIIITGEDPLKHKERAESLGAVAVFHKPVDRDELLRTIQAVFERANA